MSYLRRQQRLIIISDIIIAALSTRLLIVVCRVHNGRRINRYRLKAARVIRNFVIVFILKLLRSLNLILFGM